MSCTETGALSVFSNITNYNIIGGERGQHFDVDDHLKQLGVTTGGLNPPVWRFLQGAGTSHDHSATSATLGMSTPDLRIIDDMPGKESTPEFVLDSIAHSIGWGLDTIDIYIVVIEDEYRFIQFRIHNGAPTLSDYEVRSIESGGSYQVGTNIICMANM